MIISNPKFKDRIQKTQESTFTEECVIDKYLPIYDEYNDEIPSYSSISGIKCGVQVKTGKEVIGDKIVVTQYTVFRVSPIELSNMDRITYSGLAYEIKSIAQGHGILILDTEYLGS
jgi:hypothetical protein